MGGPGDIDTATIAFPAGFLQAALAPKPPNTGGAPAPFLYFAPFAAALTLFTPVFYIKLFNREQHVLRMKCDSESLKNEADHAIMIYKSAEGGTGYMTLKRGSIKSSTVYAALLLAIFTFLFLGTEYMYVNMLSLSVGEEKTVIAQNYALGVSALGFFLYPPVRRFLKRGAKIGLPVFLALVAVGCNFFIQRQGPYRSTLLSGLTLFLVLGFLGSMVHYLFFKLVADWEYLARLVGLSYGLGILLQFLNNNLTSLQTHEAWVLSAAMLGLVAMLPKAEKLSRAAPIEEGSPQKASRRQVASGVLLALLIVLMACIFSTLDNAVTLRSWGRRRHRPMAPAPAGGKRPGRRIPV